MDTESLQPFEIHQALHGYRDGHRLLEASLRLPAEAERAMLILSDLSGSSPVSGFDSYLTGYPVPGAAFYAFARTYYAREMERPGCVWTHTLLIGLADLARIPDLSALCSLFVRPEIAKRFARYRRPLSWEWTVSPPSTGGWSNRQASILLHALYCEPEMPLLLPAEESNALESLALAVWSQQWPRLRRSLCFSTGSLSVRTLGGDTFGIQVVPHRSKSRMTRDPDAVRWLDLDESPEPPMAPWLSAALADLQTSTRTPLREHLWLFGADVDRGRAALIPLVETYLWHHQELDSVHESCVPRLSAAEVIEHLAQHFGSPHEAARLKQSLLDAKPSSLVDAIQDREVELLRALAITQYYGAFDMEALGVPLRAEQLWRTARPKGQKLLGALLESLVNPIGEALIERLAQQVILDDLPEMERLSKGAVARLVRLNPRLASTPDAWRRPIAEQRNLLNLVAHIPALSSDEKRAIFLAFRSGGSPTLATECTALLGSEVVGWYLDTIDQDALGAMGADSWRFVLLNQPDAVLSWLKQATEPSLRTVALLTGLLLPNRAVLAAVPPARWLNWFERNTEELPPELAQSSMVFLLVLGLQTSTSSGADLAALAFEAVHQGVCSRRLTDEQWQMIEPLLPEGRFYTSRDERLRRGLIGAYVRHSWPPSSLLRTVKNTFLLEDLIRSSKEVEGGKALIKDLRREVEKGHVEVTEAQRKVLD